MASRQIINGVFVRNLRANAGYFATKRTSTVLASQSRSFTYASVSHAEEYKQAIDGRHGQQLQLAYKEGEKYENAAFDPFEAYKIDEDDAQEALRDTDNEADEDSEEDDDEEEEEDEDEEEEGEEAIPTKSMYRKDGSVRRTRAELVSLKAGAPAGGKFAIINLYGSQHKVTVDDVVILNKLRPVEKWAVGTTHTLTADDEHLLLLGSQEQTLVGMPFVNGGEVDVMVEEITRDKKVIIFKKKRRKNYRKKNGHKREVTFLRVLDIRFPENA
jgi:ribosomal protein L21